MLAHPYSSLTSQCKDRRTNIILFHFHLKRGSTFTFFWFKFKACE